MGSHFREALRDAPETVQAVLSLPDDGHVQWYPRGVEWSLRDELFAGVFDRVGQLLAVEAARGSGKAPKTPAPFPRPMRAVDLARSEAEAEYLAELDDEIAQAQARWADQQGAPDS